MAGNSNSPNNSPEQLTTTLEMFARGLYEDLPYHNWQHVEEVREAARREIEFCRSHDLEVDAFVVDTAILFHDAGFADDIDLDRFGSKERYSMHLADLYLTYLRVDDATKSHILECIASTEREVACGSLEAKIVRRADLANIAGNVFVFLLNAWKLLEEYRRLTGENIGMRAWMAQVEGNLKAYLEEDVSYGEFDHDFSSRNRFLDGALRNIQTLRRLVEAAAHDKVGNLWQKIIDSARARLGIDK